MICPPKILNENFPGDREYTLQSLVEQLGLMELHIRDGSWRLCECNPEKHLPVTAGLASEGFGFAESEKERRFMECIMSQARLFKAKIRSGEYRTQDQMDEIRSWSREARHRIEARNWSSDWKNAREILEESKTLLVELKKAPIAAVHDHYYEDFLLMEREMAKKLIERLSSKYEVKPPEIVISDKCSAPHVGLYRDGRIMMCQTGVNLHVLAHEFWHHVQKERGMHMDEGGAENFAIKLFEPQFQKSLYALHGHLNNETSKMVKTLRDVGVIYGGQQVGQGLEMALNWADIQRPAGLFGMPLSFWGDILGSIGGVVGALKLRAPWDLLAALIGGHMSTNLWRHLAGLIPAAALAVPPTAVYVPQTTRYTVKPTTPVVSQGRYMIVG